MPFYRATVKSTDKPRLILAENAGQVRSHVVKTAVNVERVSNAELTKLLQERATYETIGESEDAKTDPAE